MSVAMDLPVVIKGRPTEKRLADALRDRRWKAWRLICKDRGEALEHLAAWLKEQGRPRYTSNFHDWPEWDELLGSGPTIEEAIATWAANGSIEWPHRPPLNRRVRFAVLDRDNYTCRYCGAHAPDVWIEVDHIIPWAKGGRDDMDNLAACCFDCNFGKYDRVPEHRPHAAREIGVTV